MRYGLLLISGVGWFDGVTLAGLGRKNDHAWFRSFSLDDLSAGFDDNWKSGAHATAQSRERMDIRRFDTAALPLQIDFEPAPRAHAFDARFSPGRRRRRQQLNLSRMALEQHLGDARRPAEVAVDLERRMNVEQVG